MEFVLTTSCNFHPVFNLDPSRLAGVCVSLQDFTKEASVASSHAQIIFTVLKVHVWVNNTMAVAKWSIFQRYDTTEVVPGPLSHMFASADVTLTHTAISAFSTVYQPWHLPTASKSCNSSCQLAGRCFKIIFGVAVEVATKTTGFTFKVL